MYTNDVNYLFYSVDVPQMEKDMKDPKTRKVMIAMGVAYVVIFLLACLSI